MEAKNEYTGFLLNQIEAFNEGKLTLQELQSVIVHYPTDALRELRKDSERLDYILHNNLQITVVCGSYALYKIGDDDYLSSGATPREAIDNAMKVGE